MKNLSRVKKYIYDVLGIKMDINKNVKISNLPYFLTDRYYFYDISLLNTSFKMIELRDVEDYVTPSELSKHINSIMDSFNEMVIFLSPRIESFNRKRLIEKKISFIVPFNQMYLPMLKIDLRERFLHERKKIKKMTFSSQLVFIYLLTKGSIKNVDTKNLAKILKFSQMTVGRAFKEMEKLGLCVIKKENKRYQYVFNYELDKLLDKALEYLKTPVLKEVWIRKKIFMPELFKSGISALSEFTNLAEGRIPEMAISREDWKILKQKDSIKNNIDPYPSENSIKIEVWKYPPEITADNNIVDKISLYLSFVNNEDERIQIELEKLLEGIKYG